MGKYSAQTDRRTWYRLESLLEESLRSIGYTVWYYEMRLTIAGLQNDLSKAIGIISNFNTIHKDLKRGIVPIILSNIFSRSQRSVPSYEYDTLSKL